MNCRCERAHCASLRRQSAHSTDMDENLILQLESITKEYGAALSGGKCRVLGPVSLCVRRGEAVGIAGENGAGKSTLLSIAAGVEKQDGGNIVIAPLGRGQLGYVPQELALYPALTGRQNLSFFAAAAGLFGRRCAVRCKYLLEKMNLADKADKPVSTYSGGMQRRLNLACALVGNVKLLLLDEPTVGADESSNEIILNTVTELKNNGCAVLLVSHRAEDISRVCDRVVKLRNGVVEDEKQ